MDHPIKTVLCPECGEPLPINTDEVERFTQIVCESCCASLEIIEEDPLELAVTDIEEEFDDEDDFDDLDDLDDTEE